MELQKPPPLWPQPKEGETIIVEYVPLKPERQYDSSDVRLFVDMLTNEQRLELFSHYCTHCGCDDPRCQCWNDE